MSARDDTGQFADPGIRRSPAQGAWIQSVGKVSNRCCVQIALFADGDLVSELSRRAGVGSARSWMSSVILSRSHATLSFSPSPCRYTARTDIKWHPKPCELVRQHP